MWVPIWLIAALIVLAIVQSFNQKHQFNETLRLKLYKINELAEKIASIEDIVDNHEVNGVLSFGGGTLGEFKYKLETLKNDLVELGEAVGIEPLFIPSTSEKDNLVE